MDKRSKQIHVGCSGYYYTHWMARFYPEEVKRYQFFSYYQERFSTVELNTTFYHFPREKQVESWIDRSRDDFIFSVKAPRIITHVKQLKECEDSLILFLHLMKPLKEAGKLGVILFQTPPSFSVDMHIIEEFLTLLPRGYSYAFEFRNREYYRDEVYRILQEREMDFVAVSEPGTTPFVRSIAPFKYFRLHGTGNRYASDYSDEELIQFKEPVIDAWQNGEREVFIYFNNDYNAFAPKNATRLIELLDFSQNR